MECPNCHQNIPFFSKAVHSFGKVKTCPHCQRGMRQTLAYGKFFALAFGVGLPIKLLGVFVPALAFTKSSVTTGILFALFVFLCLRFKSVES
jgi:hypothetical protein